MDHLSVGMGSNLIEVIPKNLPDICPFEADTIHVVLAHLYKLLETVRSRLLTLTGLLDLLPAHLCQCSREMHYSVTR